MITSILYEARSPRTDIPKEVEDMPPSSRFTRLKSRLRRKTHPKLSTPYQQIRNEDPKISKASADVCSVVALAMRNVINAQAGASTTAAVAKCPQDQANQATETAIINAKLDITYAVADAVMAHINTVEPTIESVRFIEKLTSAITTAGSQTARAAADTVTSDGLPPPYTP
ncbi:hypothetical protein F4821DRAFT_258349 [Hypoxylon rubiginosum]|uniref:Uncharacterized protein n=1 Tax=Hypoxylon rubiginosum TaxID=110542 RepID=A0ACC0D620_9PEZI|nr:hypothetical protein F4821DRAFT_258349 [Hypoxylon rubiginosum]